MEGWEASAALRHPYQSFSRKAGSRTSSPARGLRTLQGRRRDRCAPPLPRGRTAPLGIAAQGGRRCPGAHPGPPTPQAHDSSVAFPHSQNKAPRDPSASPPPPGPRPEGPVSTPPQTSRSALGTTQELQALPKKGKGCWSISYSGAATQTNKTTPQGQEGRRLCTQTPRYPGLR